MDGGLHLIEQIDLLSREIGRTGIRLRFSAKLERQYEEDNRLRRSRHLIIASLVGFVLYDLFLYSDWLMIHDVFKQALIWRLGIFTPIACAGIFVLSLSPGRLLREGAAAATGVFCVIPILTLFSISTAPSRLTYHYGTLLIIIFVTLVQRIQFGFAALSVCGMLVLQFLVIEHSGLFDAAMMQSEIVFYMSAAVLIMFAGYILEQEARQNYLLSLRSYLQNRQLDHAAKIDPLTGLWNRRHLNAALNDAWVAARSCPTSMSLILLDVDQFKLFNDTFGHVEGDCCLQNIARVARNALKETDGVIFRFGGEEFLIFVSDCENAKAWAIAEHLRKTIVREQIPHGAQGAGPIVTATCGVATGIAPTISANSLLAAADDGLYEAKRAGRNCTKTGKVTIGKTYVVAKSKAEAAA